MNLSGFPQWLMTWAPTIWYVTAFVAFWCGSGAFVFRSAMRAITSSGWQRIASEPQTSSPPPPVASRDDRTVWVFSSVWVLVTAAVLGPIGAVPFALVYIYSRRLRHWMASRKRRRRPAA